MKSNCEEMMNIFYALDKNEVIPFKVSMHLLTCKECRTKVRLLTKAEKLAAKEAHKKVSLSDAQISAIINNTIKNEKSMIHPVSFVSWIIGSIVLLACLVLLNLVSSNQAESMQFCINIFIGLVVSSFAVVFIAVNLDFFIKKTEKIDIWHLLAM